MQIFLSHSSRQKPLVREVRKAFPTHISTWLDEEKLLLGDEMSLTLESAIRSETDYLLLFLDDWAARSTWVERELRWAAERERELGRAFVLVVVLDETAISLGPLDVSSRKYLKLTDFSDASVRALGQSVVSELFALICRDLQRSHNPKPTTPSKLLADADTLLAASANLVRKAVFPHRQSNPIPVETLREVVNSQSSEVIGADEFQTLLNAIVQRNLVPGLAYDGYELFLVEEHAQWKRELNHEQKVKVARSAASLIKNGMSVFLDAGSTTEEIAKILCRRIETRALTKISIATTSITHADLISDCCVAMGFDDEFSAVRLFVPGGQVRPGTQAIIPLPLEQQQLSKIALHLGGFDIGIVGVNGVHTTGGLTTHENSEALNKIDILRESRVKVVVCDSSKVGITLERKFADFQDDVLLVVNNDTDNRHLADLVLAHPTKVRIA